MSELSATFRNNTDQSKYWVVMDQGRDASAPPVIYSGYLAPAEATAAISVYSGDGVFGQVAYQRSDGPLQTGVSVTEGSEVAME